MELKVWEEKSKAAKPPLLVRLIPDENGGIDLVLVDEDGEPSDNGPYIATLQTDGKLALWSGVAENVGLSLGSNKRIKTVPV